MHSAESSANHVIESPRNKFGTELQFGRRKFNTRSAVREMREACLQPGRPGRGYWAHRTAEREGGK